MELSPSMARETAAAMAQAPAVPETCCVGHFSELMYFLKMKCYFFTFQE